MSDKYKNYPNNIDLSFVNSLNSVDFANKMTERNFIDKYVEKFETIVSSFTKINTNRLQWQ